MKDNKNPLISVIMNCFNGQNYLSEAIESVISQSYSNWEIIFWDNRSTDLSAQIALSYDDPRIKYMLSPEHTTLHEARNRALKVASGEYLAFLDVDDYWFPEKLELQLSLFNKENVGIVYSNYYIKDEVRGAQRLAIKYALPQGDVLDHLLKRHIAGLLTLIIRKSAILPFNEPFDSSYRIMGDYDLLVTLAKTWKFACIDRPMAVYRVHQKNESGPQNNHVLISEWEYFAAKHSVDPVISSNVNFCWVNIRICYTKAMDALRSGQKKIAVENYFKMDWSILKIKLLIFLLIPRQTILFLDKKTHHQV
ncbi:WcaA Glycosyltransferases involved in cell wall biogenesis [Burkholderiaceae bacterium]